MGLTIKQDGAEVYIGKRRECVTIAVKANGNQAFTFLSNKQAKRISDYLKDVD